MLALRDRTDPAMRVQAEPPIERSTCIPLPVTDSASSSPRDDRYDFSQQVGHLLRRAYQAHVSIFQQLIPDSQLTAAQFVALCAVRDSSPCSLNDVVRATAIDQATARGVVDRLKARELLAVSPDPADGRKVLIQLTKEGQRLVDRMIPSARQISEATFGSLNPAERVAVVYLLEKMSSFGADGTEK